MENQDHNKPIPNHSGYDGHGGGVHVCRKCGWPFPNPHPSSKNRRAHKKVCGTIDKYTLNNDGHDKTRMESFDGEPHSDDEFETPSDKGVERTISRRSSSGVGSRSSRSARSEDDVFTDAVTEFNESPGVVGKEASGGVLQRYYSMQNENEQDDNKPAEENPISSVDNLCTTDLLKDNQLQNVEGEKDKVKVGVASEDHISTNLSLVSASVTLEIENALDQNIMQSSKPSNELGIVSERGKEIISSEDKSGLRTSYSENPEEGTEDVCILKGACDEAQDAIDEQLIKTSLMEIDGVEASNEMSNEVDSTGNGYLSKSEIDEEHGSKIVANENVHALDVPDVLPLEQHPEIAVDDLDYIRGKNDFSEAPDSTARIVEYKKGCFVEESGSNIGYTETTDSSREFSEGFSVGSLDDKREESQKSLAEQKTFGELDHRSGANSSNADINICKSGVVGDLKSENSEDKKDSCTEEKRPITSQGDIFLEGATMDAGETSSNEDSIRSKAEDDGEYFTVMDNDGSKVSEDDLAVKNSVFSKPTLDETTLQVLEHIHTSNGLGNDENIIVEDAVLNENDSIGDSKEPGRITDHGKLDRISDSGDMILGHLQGESLLSSQCIGEIESSDKNTQLEECMVDNGNIATLKTNYHRNSTSKVDVVENAESSEDTSCMTEGDRVIKQHVAISAIDTIVDSGSLADSLDGNWGSVSVMSATSDAIPTTDTIALNHPRALDGEEILGMVPKPVIEDQHTLSQNQVSIQPEVGIEQIERASEIHSSEEHVANDLDKGKKNKEIIDKVDNWDSGKQNAPLKTLLGEATARSRAESPIHHNQSSSSTFVPQRDQISGTNNGFSVKKEKVILISDHHEMETTHEETGKEWNSPARYPVNIKTEKKRSKSRPYWAPFLCCSSVYAR